MSEKEYVCPGCGAYSTPDDSKPCVCKKPSTMTDRCLNYDDPCEPESCDGYYTDCEEYRKKPSTTFEREFEEKVKEIADEVMGKGPFWSFGTSELKKFAKRFYDMGKEA